MIHEFIIKNLCSIGRQKNYCFSFLRKKFNYLFVLNNHVKFYFYSFGSKNLDNTIGHDVSCIIKKVSKEKSVFSLSDWKDIIQSETYHCVHELRPDDMMNFQNHFERKFWKKINLNNVSFLMVKPDRQVIYINNGETNRNYDFYNLNK